MKKILSVLFVVSVASLALSGCGKNDDSAPQYADVTQDFLTQVGGNTYTKGEKRDERDRSEVSISHDGKIKIKTIDYSCPLVETGNIVRAQRFPGHQQVEITYTITEAHVSGTKADSSNCREFIEEYRFKHVPENHTIISCGYSMEFVDFACDGKREKSSSSNWVIHN